MNDEQGQSMPAHQSQANSAQRLAALRARREMLEAEIAETGRLAELEAKREAPSKSSQTTQGKRGVPAA